MRGVDAALQPLQPVALLDHLGDVAVRGRRLGPGEVRRRRLAAPRGRGRPRRCRPPRRSDRPRCGSWPRRPAPPARSSCPRTGRRRRTSSRGRRSAARTPRCARERARPAGAGSARRAARCGRGVSRKATSSSPSSFTRTGGQSGSGSSHASSAGIQYRRIVAPIGVPGPTRVTRSLSSRASMASSGITAAVGAGRESTRRGPTAAAAPGAAPLPAGRGPRGPTAPRRRSPGSSGCSARRSHSPPRSTDSSTSRYGTAS